MYRRHKLTPIKYQTASIIGDTTLDEAEQASLGGDIKAFSELTNNVLEVSKNITTLFSWLISDILTAYVPEPAVKTQKFDDGPKLSEFALPYFFDEDEEDWTRKYREKSEKEQQ